MQASLFIDKFPRCSAAKALKGGEHSRQENLRKGRDPTTHFWRGASPPGRGG